ncbi:hypothetical protein GALMADRAFT_102730 [Galerina marginata CBS 339.88]|uniref:Cytochrome P450 n=1 Tax=Galerina marginata (strain CBS 339.88) TaxID=685588 RepID=A0A067SXA5_GALM3|nr:hypothetical protein GALMADRAFT_102730 [Galerina marginata CBS 339.88]
MIPAPTGLGFLVFLATFAATAFIYTKGKTCLRPPYPPGPRKLPVLGNLLDLPTKFEWETYARWGKKYKSEIIHLNAAGYDIVVLNSFDAANDIMERRSATYSSRPPLTMINELMGWSWFIATMPYGETWREGRRAFAKYFQNGNAAIYQAPQAEIVRKMLPRLLDNPQDFLTISQHAIGGMALSLAYGLTIKNSNDPFVHLAEEAIASLAEAGTPGAFLVDIFPILKYIPEFFPGASFKKKARAWRKVQEEMREAPYQETVRNMASGFAKPSFTSTSLQGLEESEDVQHQQEIIRDTAAIIFAAGAETTATTVHTFFAAMLCNPEAQKKAQQELDFVLKGRLPEFSDELDLPYVSALVKEVIRWKPATPLGGVPHYSSEEDVYSGYHIPKGAIVLANTWAMLHDENAYPDPSTFKPERFLKDGKLNPLIRDPVSMAFGFGRRMCPGNHIALSVLWLIAATILATFDISKAVDENGKPIEPAIEYHSAMVSYPLPFKCTIKARSRSAEELIRSAGESY